jgi:hypothetical protein
MVGGETNSRRPAFQPRRLSDSRKLAVEMGERGLQRRTAALVSRLHLVKDAAARQLQTFPFLTPLDFIDIGTPPLAARRGALVFGILPVRFNCLAFESSCHRKIGVHVARLSPRNGAKLDYK